MHYSRRSDDNSATDADWLAAESDHITLGDPRPSVGLSRWRGQAQVAFLRPNSCCASALASAALRDSLISRRDVHRVSPVVPSFLGLLQSHQQQTCRRPRWNATKVGYCTFLSNTNESRKRTCSSNTPVRQEWHQKGRAPVPRRFRLIDVEMDLGRYASRGKCVWSLGFRRRGDRNLFLGACGGWVGD